MPGASTNNPIGNTLIQLGTTESTNNYAMELVHNGLARHGIAIFAYEQTLGRGQRGKQWLTSRGDNIILSVLLDASRLQVSDIFLLSMTMALAAQEFFGKYAGDETFVKWPNDLYWRDRKAGGILIENVITGNKWQWAVAGFGININQTNFDRALQNAVSLKQITGKSFIPIDLAGELCDCLQKRFDQLMNGKSQAITEEYNNVLYKKDRDITLKKNNIVFSCKVKGVNKFGQLITETNTEQLFEVGEIEWII